MSSKLDYLSKYYGESNKNGDKKKKKKSKKKIKKEQTRLQDEDDLVELESAKEETRDLSDHHHDDEDDDAPVVVAAEELTTRRGTWEDRGGRKRLDSSDEEKHHKGRRKRRERYDSSDDEGVKRENEELRPTRTTRRYDSKDDNVKVEEGTSPSRRRRYDSSSEDESNSKRKRRYDSSSSEEEGSSKRKRRYGSSSEEDEENDSKRRRRYDSSSDDEDDSPKERMSSGHMAGLQSGQKFSKSEAKLQKKRAREAQVMADKYGHGETVYRNRQQSSTKSKEEEAAAAAALNTGRVQKEQAEQRQADWEDLQTSTFARHADDRKLEELRKNAIRAGDPMAAQQTVRQTKKKSATSTNTQSKPVYKGPPAKANRYGIRPGFRWDGVDRGNGFEDKLLAQHFHKQHRKEQEYKWSVADM